RSRPSPGLGGGRGAGRGGRRPRGEFGDRADPGLGPAVQPAGPPRALAPVRRDARLRPTGGLRRLGPPPEPQGRLPRVLRRLAALLAGTARRAGRDVRRLLPRDVAAPERVLRPAVLDQLRGRREDPARP